MTQGCYGIGPERQEHNPPELYHLEHDAAEKYNIAAFYPDVIKRLKTVAEERRCSIQPAEN